MSPTSYQTALPRDGLPQLSWKHLASALADEGILPGRAPAVDQGFQRLKPARSDAPLAPLPALGKIS